jgi:hypothetical protein
MNNEVTISNGHLTKDMPAAAWKKLARKNKDGVLSWGKYVEVEKIPVVQPGKPLGTTYIPPVVEKMVAKEAPYEIRHAAPAGTGSIEAPKDITEKPEPPKIEVKKTEAPKGKPGPKSKKA